MSKCASDPVLNFVVDNLGGFVYEQNVFDASADDGHVENDIGRVCQ